VFQSYVQLTALKNPLCTSSLPVKIIERSLYSSHYCFTENFYQTKKLHQAEFELLNEWFNFLTTSPQLNFKVDLIVYLQTHPEKALERIKNRARNEESQISLEYLKQIHDLHENWLSNHKFSLPAPVLIINANKNLAEMELDYQKYKDVILGQAGFIEYVKFVS
jgi:deoxyadenosine/deoxycytidine kinase